MPDTLTSKVSRWAYLPYDCWEKQDKATPSFQSTVSTHRRKRKASHPKTLPPRTEDKLCMALDGCIWLGVGGDRACAAYSLLDHEMSGTFPSFTYGRRVLALSLSIAQHPRTSHLPHTSAFLGVLWKAMALLLIA